MKTNSVIYNGEGPGAGCCMSALLWQTRPAHHFHQHSVTDAGLHVFLYTDGEKCQYLTGSSGLGLTA